MIGYCVLQNLWLESFHFQGHIYVGFRLHNMYTILHNHGYEKLFNRFNHPFQIGTLEFPSIKWITWGVLTLMCLIIVVKRYLIYQSI